MEEYYIRVKTDQETLTNIGKLIQRLDNVQLIESLSKENQEAKKEIARMHKEADQTMINFFKWFTNQRVDKRKTTIEWLTAFDKKEKRERIVQKTKKGEKEEDDKHKP